MKDSGIEWLGEVPEHWEIKKIKYLFKQIDERNNSEDAELLSLYTDIYICSLKS
ncbi:Type I restriction-modification system specificity subunit S [Geobacillus stearothermophilus]|uniref:Type I restriction-modification system specificity subunit S n=1 Tax=Geobacillus stearothermophilus TaxID=1422 RepID=A0ABQ7HKJ3_GEOSE|nr:Type I restriction-modification system specificity subunit S [Geobacillus stearothermophilus]